MSALPLPYPDNRAYCARGCAWLTFRVTQTEGTCRRHRVTLPAEPVDGIVRTRRCEGCLAETGDLVVCEVTQEYAPMPPLPGQNRSGLWYGTVKPRQEKLL